MIASVRGVDLRRRLATLRLIASMHANAMHEAASDTCAQTRVMALRVRAGECERAALVGPASVVTAETRECLGGGVSVPR